METFSMTEADMVGQPLFADVCRLPDVPPGATLVLEEGDDELTERLRDDVMVINASQEHACVKYDGEYVGQRMASAEEARVLAAAGGNAEHLLAVARALGARAAGAAAQASGAAGGSDLDADEEDDAGGGSDDDDDDEEEEDDYARMDGAGAQTAGSAHGAGAGGGLADPSTLMAAGTEEEGEGAPAGADGAAPSGGEAGSCGGDAHASAAEGESGGVEKPPTEKQAALRRRNVGMWSSVGWPTARASQCTRGRWCGVSGLVCGALQRCKREAARWVLCVVGGLTRVCVRTPAVRRTAGTRRMCGPRGGAARPQVR
jgi:hypothetical protein